MEDQKASVKKIATTYGVIWGLLSIALSVITYVTDNYLERPWWITVLSTAITIGVIVYGLKAYKQENEGFLSVAESLKIGLAISLIAGIIATIYGYIFMTVIEPDFANQMLEAAREQMITQNPDMGQEQIDLAMGITEKMMEPWIMTAMGMIFTLFFGFIVSLIAGLVMKQNRPELQ